MSVETVNDDAFKARISENAKVVVKYFADWCGSCKLISPKYKRLSNDDRFSDVVFLDVDAEENEYARSLASVNNLPYFAVFKDGELVSGDATAKEEGIVKLIESIQ